MNHNNDWQEYRSGFNSEEERFELKRDDFERPRNIYREQRTVVQRDHSSCLGNGIRAFFMFLLSVFALIGMASVIYVCVNGFPNEQDEIGNGETESMTTSTATYSGEYDQCFDVRSKTKKGRICIGMSKKEVYEILGQPTEFSFSEYSDNIVYKYGEHNLNRLKIDFEKGKVVSVNQY